MEPARKELEAAIDEVNFNVPTCPVYQNVTAKAVTSPDEIKQNLKAQLTGSVRWTQSVQQMIDDGATQFAELGPGKALSGMIKKINREAEILS
jgi:[acyl-carrier-protein] S-malonyltransferase